MHYRFGRNSAGLFPWTRDGEGCRSRLTGDTEKWEAIICKGAGRLTEAERETLASFFRQAERDPLRFLILLVFHLATFSRTWNTLRYKKQLGIP